jgi:type IV pilus assembly protein PilM
MANFFSNLLNKQSQSVLGIDIGSSSIKMVQLSTKGGHPVLETYGELALGPYGGKGVGESVNLPIEKIIEAISDMVHEKEVNVTTKLCGLAIPFSSSLMVVIDMPLMTKGQLDQMVPIEARKYVPVPISEVTLDWYVIPKDKNTELEVAPPEIGASTPVPTQKVEVLVVALHNDTISRYKDIVPVLIIDMGATTTKLYIVEKGILRSSHMINRGSQNITNELSKSLGITLEDAEYLKREKGIQGEINGIKVENIVQITLSYIFSEANQILLAYQKKYNRNISKVMLVGGGSALKGIADSAKNSFQTEVIAGDPFGKVVAPAFLEKVLKDTGPEFAVAVGVALRRLQEIG